jgi:hypothetical protein
MFDDDGKAGRRETGKTSIPSLQQWLALFPGRATGNGSTASASPYARLPPCRHYTKLIGHCAIAQACLRPKIRQPVQRPAARNCRGW